MSRASEWAKDRPAGCEYAGQTVALVDPWGAAYVAGHDDTGAVVWVTIPTAHALVLGQWFLDTFADEAGGECRRAL